MYDDFDTEPIGGGNPYSRCVHCKISVPQINYSLEGHADWCDYRKRKESSRNFDEIIKHLQKYDPATGEENPYPSEASQYRGWHGAVAWLFNPYTEDRRDPADIGSDVFGVALVESLK